MITQLTPEQEARLPEWAERWIKIGLCTEPADRPRAEKAVRDLYRLANFPGVPAIWVPSPMAGAFAAPIAANLIAIRNGNAVHTAVGNAVGNAVDTAVGNAVRTAVDNAVGNAVHTAVGNAVNIWWHYWIGGQFMGWYPSYATYFRDVVGLPIPIDAYASLAESAGCVWCNGSFAMICERPVRLTRDDAGQLDANDCMAIEYPDGWGMWMIHGVAVDEQIVMRPESQSVGAIRGEQNEEIKRIRIERFAGRDHPPADGWQRYLRAVKARVINQRDNAVENTKEVLVRTPDGLTTLVCACPSTARVYALEVPKETETCESAQRFLWSGSRLAERTRVNIIGRS